jgi:Type II/IV secretion system protein
VVHPGIGLTFAIALRSIFRQDPDMIMVGDMRAALGGLSIAAGLALGSAPAVAIDLIPQPQPGAVPANPLATQPLDGLSATRDRPLFSSNRRPPPPPVALAPAPALPPPPPNVAFLGVVMDGSEAIAVVRARPSGEFTRVQIGDDVGGWKVSQIAERRLVLSLEGRFATFTLFSGEGAKQPAGGIPISKPVDPGTPSKHRQASK